MLKRDYSTYTKTQLIEHIHALEKRKKYGLVWEEEKTKEKFETEAERKLPVLVEDKKKEINGNDTKPTHILIEGDCTILNETTCNHKTVQRTGKYPDLFGSQCDFTRSYTTFCFL